MFYTCLSLSDIVPVGVIAGGSVGSSILLLLLLFALIFYLYRQRKGSEYTVYMYVALCVCICVSCSFVCDEFVQFITGVQIPRKYIYMCIKRQSSGSQISRWCLIVVWCPRVARKQKNKKKQKKGLSRTCLGHISPWKYEKLYF